MVVKKYFQSFQDFVVFLGAVFIALPEVLHRRQRRWKDFYYYFDLCGCQSLGISTLICLLMGLILGIQSVIQMKKLGAEIYMIDLIGFVVLKELGPLMVAMVATGRAASAFAAEIGTMKVNEEVSALRTLGINPEGFLVLPKLFAMLVVIPMLTVFGNAAGLLGGMLIGVTFAKIPAAAYWSRSLVVIDCPTILFGLLKSVIFSILITVAGCYCGFTGDSDAQGVGRSATKAVVLSILFVIIGDAILTLLFSFIGY